MSDAARRDRRAPRARRISPAAVRWHPRSSWPGRTPRLAAIGAVELAIGLLAAGAGNAAAPKKLIESGYDEPDTRFIREHVEEMEQSPFDGLLFHVVSDRGDSLTWHIWSHQRFERSDFDGAVADLDSTRFRRFTEMFLRVSSSPGDVSWFDDEGWATIAHNFAVAAAIARDGHVRGLFFDSEQYFHAVVRSPDDPDPLAGDRSRSTG